MATFISLVNFTDQGRRNIKESPDRADAFRGLCTKLDVAVRGMYWTSGRHDMVVITDGPEDAATAAGLTVNSLGNVSAQVMRAYTVDEMRRIISKMP
jgi:uncharacterized protein with GYD domain